MKKVVVSGGFDPVHVGHLRLFKEAKKFGDHLTVILNTDNFLKNKKGYFFMPFKERKEIISSFSCVDKVEKSIDKDETVIKTLEKLSKNNDIDVFANGGDRKNVADIPEYDFCKKNKIKMIFDIGGDKIQSSSSLITRFKNYQEDRPWGNFENLLKDEFYLVKRIIVKEGEQLSVQYHNHRSEKWIIVKGIGLLTIGKKKKEASYGSSFDIKAKEIHSIENIGKENLEIIEVQLGNLISENDIVRISDKYGRKK